MAEEFKVCQLTGPRVAVAAAATFLLLGATSYASFSYGRAAPARCRLTFTDGGAVSEENMQDLVRTDEWKLPRPRWSDSFRACVCDDYTASSGILPTDIPLSTHLPVWIAPQDLFDLRTEGKIDIPNDEDLPSGFGESDHVKVCLRHEYLVDLFNPNSTGAVHCHSRNGTKVESLFLGFDGALYCSAGGSASPPPSPNEQLKSKVQEWCRNATAATMKYGNISHWPTSAVTSMSGLWNQIDCGNVDVPALFWDTSAVTNMTNMFSGSQFNQPLNFDTSAVTDMSWMFYESQFNQPLNFSSTSAVTDMSYMFCRSPFNQPLNFDTSAVTDMSYMFLSSPFNQPLNFDTSAVTDMSWMFSDSPFNQPLNFDTSVVTDMTSMFFYNTLFNQPLNFSSTSVVTTMSSMFDAASSFNQPLNFDVSAVTDMSYMFSDSPFNQTLNFDTSAVTDMSYMFSDSQFNQPLNFDTSAVTDMSNMFAESRFNQPLNFSSTSAVTTMQGMFSYHAQFNQPLNFDMSAVTHMTEMFYQAIAFNQSVNNFNTSAVQTMVKMFESASNFENGGEILCLSIPSNASQAEAMLKGTAMTPAKVCDAMNVTGLFT